METAIVNSCTMQSVHFLPWKRILKHREVKQFAYNHCIGIKNLGVGQRPSDPADYVSNFQTTLPYPTIVQIRNWHILRNLEILPLPVTKQSFFFCSKRSDSILRAYSFS
jgi:hypothetical protein